ncbi:MAG TPA: VOC family protein [Lysobacter sp.]|nr:VOC family protein [Lysobacter sp.]
MMTRPIFHLSLPVRDLAATRTFYCTFLGATAGRIRPDWMDLIVFGHQLTFHARPDEVLPPEHRGVRHFGAILQWDAWEQLGRHIEESGQAFVMPPTVIGSGTADEHAKMLLEDPSGNLIEIKAYRDTGALFRKA